MHSVPKSLPHRSERRPAASRTRSGILFAAICGLALAAALMGAAAEAADSLATVSIVAAGSQ